MTAGAGQEVALRLGLDPFGNDAQPQALGERDNGTRNGGIIGVGEHVPHKGSVDLQLVERQAFQVGQRRKSSTKIIQRKGESLGPQGKHLFYHLLDVGGEHAFSEFQFETSWVGPVVLSTAST